MGLADELLAAKREATDMLLQHADREISQFFAGLDISNPARAREAIKIAATYWTQDYGKIAAILAADFYEALGGDRADLAQPIPTRVVHRRVHGVTFAVYDGDLAAAASATKRVIKHGIDQAGRDTVARNAQRDGVRWARVPSLVNKPCAFCVMLASRGSTYASKDKALLRADGHKYHYDCRCEAVPIGLWDAYPAGYDPDFMYNEIYLPARRSLSGKDQYNTSEILKRMRRMSPEHLSDKVHEDDADDHPKAA